MLGALIKDYGFSWSDFDDMSEEDLHDIVNAKAEFKKRQKEQAERQEKQKPVENSLESLLKNTGIL